MRCSVILFSTIFCLGLASGGYIPSEEEMCFSEAFDNSSWVQCVSPILEDIQGEFNVTRICLSGEVGAMHCLMDKLNECFDIKDFAGLTPQQSAFISIDTLSTADLVNLTCEIYGGQCDELANCDEASIIMKETGPLIEAAQAVIRLCGPKCVHNNKDRCPGLVDFYYQSTFPNFTENFDATRTARTQVFVDNHCLRAADFDVTCATEKLKSPEFLTCYSEAVRTCPALNNIMSCSHLESIKSCMEIAIAPACGELTTDLLLEGVLVAVSEIPSESCFQRLSNAGLRAPISFLLFSVLMLIQLAVTSLIF